ncbi:MULTISPECIES: cysteine--tRNA ligase [unclassified Bradyrhizobium]|uniref:cysteine--tRNA ligase n=1 Tax=unclassified Bradyrhizobium TaxID=2631580 RepID=UPI0028F0BE22|nr:MULTISPECIES: cysteine--tRNA ligase [unclassified Bradyrhizobium]
MELRLYDTSSREKRSFVPLDPNNVRMYVCGPTVYDFAHIGNARPVIVFDVLFRLLRHRYGADHVTYVRNITDVDDKINDRAARDYPGLPLNEAIRKVTELTEQQFHDDVDALGCLRPTIEPRATEHIAEMRAIIEKLVAGGFAYVEQDHVLFSPGAMNAANSVLPRYGALANRSLDEMIAGARVDVAPYKRDATDFVLWKPSKPGEPSWPSPAGIKVEGRPGWHIECSAMSWKHLGETFDIHGGGIDLVFPHHENEVAQSCCAFHTSRMANVWMHNGFLQVEGEKMSKSLGNFVTIRELLTGWAGIPWQGEIIRLAMLGTNYRQPIDFSVDALEQAMTALRYFKRFSRVNPAVLPSEEFVNALLDDLNTPRAIAELHRLLKLARNSQAHLVGRMSQPGAIMSDDDWLAGEQLAAGLRLLGIDIERYDPDRLQKRASSQISSEQYKRISDLVDARAAARARKDFKESDRIRDELAAMGVVLKDGKGPDGKPVTTWEIAR